VRRDELHRIEQMQKNGEVAEDESKRATARLQKTVDSSIEKVDGLANRKEREVMEV
jgi:ribosome recycling factor